MPRIEESIVIGRPCAEVFAYLENRSHDPEWMVSVLESQWLDRDSVSSHLGAVVGRRGRMVMAIEGKPTEFIDEASEYEPGRRVAHRTVEGPIPLNTACISEPVDGGCKATGVSDQGKKRQLTLIETEVWQQLMTDLGGMASPSARRANLMLSGIRLAETCGRVLQVGAVRARTHGETKPCYRMDEVLPGLRDAMKPDWRGGVFAEALDDGIISVGDAVFWL